MRPPDSLSVSVFTASPSGEGFVDLGAHDAFVRNNFPVFAVKSDLEPAVRHHHVAPGATDSQIDVGDRDLALVAHSTNP